MFGYCFLKRFIAIEEISLHIKCFFLKYCVKNPSPQPNSSVLFF